MPRLRFSGLGCRRGVTDSKTCSDTPLEFYPTGGPGQAGGEEFGIVACLMRFFFNGCPRRPGSAAAGDTEGEPALMGAGSPGFMRTEAFYRLP